MAALKKNEQALSNVLEAVLGGNSFLVTSHANPDGDAVGSMLCVYHLLRALGKRDVLCVNEDPVPRNYQWLPGAADIVTDCAAWKAVDVAIVVDVARADRLGRVKEAVAKAGKTVVIDHHLEDRPDGDVRFVDATYAAVGEMVVELFMAAGAPISREAAECAYVSIVTDTGGFRFANTTARSHRIAAALLETGIDVPEISCRVFDELSMPKFKLLTLVLERMRCDAGGRVAYSTLTAADIEGAAAEQEDFSGLVDFARNIRGVDVGILFREVNEKSTKVSVRSHSAFNSADFLRKFGGGGHLGAAGATIELPIEEARAAVLTEIRRELNGNDRARAK
jgi:phosphoesterase RecJ-like protein